MHYGPQNIPQRELDPLQNVQEVRPPELSVITTRDWTTIFEQKGQSLIAVYACWAQLNMKTLATLKRGTDVRQSGMTVTNGRALLDSNPFPAHPARISGCKYLS